MYCKAEKEGLQFANFLSEIQSCLQVRASYYSGVLFASLASQKTSNKEKQCAQLLVNILLIFPFLDWAFMLQKQFNTVFNATAIYLFLPPFLFLFVSLLFIALGSHKN